MLHCLYECPCFMGEPDLVVMFISSLYLCIFMGEPDLVNMSIGLFHLCMFSCFVEADSVNQCAECSRSSLPPCDGRGSEQWLILP